MIKTAHVTALVRSNPMEVVRSKRRNRWRLKATPAPGTNRVPGLRSDEGPEPEVGEHAVDQRGHDSVAGKEEAFRKASHRREGSRTETDPGGREHLEREPWTDATGDERRREERDRTEHEAEPSPEDTTGQDEQEPLRLEAVDSWAGDAQGGEASGQDAEQSYRLGVDATFGEFGHHDGDRAAEPARRTPTAHRRCAPCWRLQLWWISKGQPNAAMPKIVVTPSRTEDRWPSRMAGTW